ncbi:hypothetical protein F5X98DRAFT_370467 [Xylaria grammica]|nr:hypothetical protein F5X98DRAFT_370467 [Xylaria grammica]
MPVSLISSLRALSLRTKPAFRIVPTLRRQQPAVRSISQNALAPAQAQRPAIMRPAAAIRATLLQQQTRGMKVHSSVKKRCEHCKVSQVLKLGYDRETTRSSPAASWAQHGQLIV